MPKIEAGFRLHFDNRGRTTELPPYAGRGQETERGRPRTTLLCEVPPPPPPPRILTACRKRVVMAAVTKVFAGPVREATDTAPDMRRCSIVKISS